MVGIYFRNFCFLTCKGINSQVVIQTPVVEGDNILTQEGLLEHVTILEQIAKYEVNVAGEYV